MNKVIFKCDISGYMIEYMVLDKSAHFNCLNIDISELNSTEWKLFIQLVRRSINTLKDEGIENIYQSVNLDDWYGFLKNVTNFRIHKEDPKIGICEIYCSTNDFLENFGKGLGLVLQ